MDNDMEKALQTPVTCQQCSVYQTLMQRTHRDFENAAHSVTIDSPQTLLTLFCIEGQSSYFSLTSGSVKKRVIGRFLLPHVEAETFDRCYLRPLQEDGPGFEWERFHLLVG